MMNASENKDQGLIEDRLIILRRFPKELVASLTREELNIFLHEEELPLSLGEKLKGYLTD